MSDQLRAAGIEVQKGWDPARLSGVPDLVVVIGNVARPDNPEARAAIDAGLPYVSFCDALEHFFLRGKHSVVITGTHGKTTTTSIVAWMLTHAGRDPSALIGGVFENFGGSFRLGEGREFVVEGDEYDTAFFDKTPKFLHYDARTALITSVEFDHADIYPSIHEIQDAFRQLVVSIPSDGRIIAATDSDTVRAVLAGAQAPVEGYGFRDGALWRVSDVAFDPEGTQFTVWKRDERAARVRMPLFGRHNVENVLGAIAVCASLGLPPEQAARAMVDFKGIKRRQELRGEAAGMAVIDDFAHHPTAVRGTVTAIRLPATPSASARRDLRAAQQHQPASGVRATTPTRSPRPTRRFSRASSRRPTRWPSPTCSAPTSSSSRSARRASKRTTSPASTTSSSTWCAATAARTSCWSCRTAASGTSGSACSRACARASPGAKGPTGAHRRICSAVPSISEPRRQRAARGSLRGRRHQSQQPAASARAGGREPSARSCGCPTPRRARSRPGGRDPLRVIRRKGGVRGVYLHIHGGGRARRRGHDGPALDALASRAGVGGERRLPARAALSRRARRLRGRGGLARRERAPRVRERPARDRRRVRGRALVRGDAGPAARPPRRHAVLRREPGLRHLRPDLHPDRAQLGRADPGPVHAGHRVVLEPLRAGRVEARRAGRLAALRRSASPAAGALHDRHAGPAARRQPVLRAGAPPATAPARRLQAGAAGLFTPDREPPLRPSWRTDCQGCVQATNCAAARTYSTGARSA
jgi:UDP-N-acetylmuramate:L-alanyl-gamma-D-glutamyl-meso-diaminopimelate ligase